MININVKAKEENALGVGYSFTINKEIPQTNLAYLNENRVKNFLKAKTEFQPLTREQQHNHFGLGMLAAVSVPVANTMGFLFQHEYAIATATGTIKHINLMKQLMPIVSLIQDFALPLSIAVACWGCIEWIIGSPGWKHKLKGAIIGLIAIYLIPFGFMSISDALGHL